MSQNHQDVTKPSGFHKLTRCQKSPGCHKINRMSHNKDDVTEYRRHHIMMSQNQEDDTKSPGCHKINRMSLNKVEITNLEEYHKIKMSQLKKMSQITTSSFKNKNIKQCIYFEIVSSITS